MKKVLIVSSSPRKNGNSDILARAFEKGALEAGNQVEFISLRERKIGYCMACNYCHERGNNTCVLKDDMKEILEKMKEADTYVLATPVYYYNVSAQMKTFIDRTYACFFELKNKELYYLVTCTDPGEECIGKAAEGLNGFAACLPYSQVKGIVYGTGNAKHGDIQGKSQVDEAYEYGLHV